MKLIEIRGKIWELTILWDDKYADGGEASLAERNSRAIHGLGWFRGIVRVLANHGVKSKATAVIEITVNGLPSQAVYDIYHNSKGFFCIVQAERVFLAGLVQVAP